VGLVDTGVAPHHPDTDGRFRAGFDSVQIGVSDFAHGITPLGVTQIDTKPMDDYVGHGPWDYYVGHGMGCAGIIGARGEEIPPGLAGDSPMLPIRVLGAAKLPGKPQPVGLGSIADIDLGLKMAVDLGAKVLNLSFGTLDSTLEPLSPKPHADTV